MIHIRRGDSHYEILEYPDRTEISVYDVSEIPPTYINTIVISEDEYRKD